MRTNLHHLIEEQARARPAAPAVSFKDSTLSYSELADAVARVAGGLRVLGVERGERVAVFAEKRLETVETIFGTSAAGAVFVPINPLLRGPQVAYILADCEVSVLVTTAERLKQIGTDLLTIHSLRHVVVIGALSESTGGSFELRGWGDLVVSEAANTPPGAPTDYDTAAILYTSGSTGRPKGVVLSHRNLIVGAESVSSYLHNGPDDVILAALPLSFDAGFSQVTTAFAVGAHVVLMNYLLPKDVVRLCARHQVTGLTCVPPLWIQIAAVEWPDDARNQLRYFANTGGRMPKTTLDRLRELFPQALPYLMYGLTEAFRSTYLDPEEVDGRPDSIGKAIPNAEIVVARPDGSICADGEEGELVHRGPLVALGYWGDRERTDQRFRPAPGSSEQAWRVPELAVWSGDTVVRDAEGFLYFVGRKDDMIKTSGYRVSPTEVEEAAYASGLVRDAVALGVADDRLGQRVVLVASPVEGTALDVAALTTSMKRALPAYMVPSSVDVRESIPRSPNGKFDRVALRTELNR